MTDESKELLSRWRAGDQQAAEDLYLRYASRLIALSRTYLSEKYSTRVDAEDVVQSAFRSFFRGSREGRYLLQHSGDLWRLLVAIARHKLEHQVRRHRAAKRSVKREVPLKDDRTDVGSSAGVDLPSPSDALVLAEEIDRIMEKLRPIERRMFELRLEAYTLDEIAEDTERSQRTVRRVMDRVKAILQEQL